MDQVVRSSRTSCALAYLFSAIGLTITLVACGGGGGDGGGGGAPAAPPPPAPPAAPRFSSFQAAELVIGQLTFDVGEPNRERAAPDADTLAGPSSLEVNGDGQLFVADTANARIVRFDEVPATNGASASMLLSSTRNPPEIVVPVGVAESAGKLVVVDRDAHRVLIYQSNPGSDELPTLSVVVGQDGLGTPDQTCDAAHLSFPTDARITPDGKLVVTDSGHSRVMIWNQVPGVTDILPAANVVLGQLDFNSCDANRGTGVPAANSMASPQALWTDGSKLAVADFANNRVLLWDQLTMQDGQPASRALGQPDTGSNSVLAPPTASSMRLPGGLASDGVRFAVSDSSNHRVLIWNGWPSRDGQAADVVLGQRDLGLRTRNDDNGDGLIDSPSAKTLSSPAGLAFHDGNLLVTDSGNHRVLVFKPK